MTTVTLTQIAKQLKVNPKIARRRLRDALEANPSIEGSIVGDGSRWVFPARSRATIVAAIRA